MSLVIYNKILFSVLKFFKNVYKKRKKKILTVVLTHTPYFLLFKESPF